jgi:hypothetical protein
MPILQAHVGGSLLSLTIKNLGHPGELQFIADLAQQLFAPDDSLFVFDAFTLTAIDMLANIP